MEKKIIIFGGSGFIGGRLATFFRKKERYIVKTPSRAECDLLNTESISIAIKNADKNTFLIVCAAIGRLQDDSFDSMNKNCAMVYNLTSQKFKRGALGGVIFMSSVDVYGRPPNNLPVDEGSYPKADSFYGMSKYASEMILKKGMEDICPVTILRLPGVYGYDDRHNSVVGRFVKQAYKSKAIRIFGDGNQKRDYIDVVDICRMVKKLINHPVNDIFNFVTGESHSLNDIAKIIRTHSPKRIEVIYEQKNITGYFDLCFSNVKLMRYLKHFAFRSLDEGITEYIGNMP